MLFDGSSGPMVLIIASKRGNPVNSSLCEILGPSVDDWPPLADSASAGAICGKEGKPRVDNGVADDIVGAGGTDAVCGASTGRGLMLC